MAKAKSRVRRSATPRLRAFAPSGGARAVAKKMGLHPSVVTLWFSGKRAVPIARMPALAAALGVSVETLFRLTETRCRAHGKSLPCPSCAAALEKINAHWRDPAYRARHRRALETVERAWTEDEDAIIRKMAGWYPAEEITRVVNEMRVKRQAGLKPRALASLFEHAESIGVSLLRDQRIVSKEQARIVLGCGRNTLRNWQKAGWLVGRAWGKHWVFEMEELEAFIRERPWTVVVSQMPPSQLRLLSEALTRRNPYLPSLEFSRLAKVHKSTVQEYIRRGLLPAEQQPGYNGAYMIRASEVATIRALVAESMSHRPQNMRMAA